MFRFKKSNQIPKIRIMYSKWWLFYLLVEWALARQLIVQLEPTIAVEPILRKLRLENSVEVLKLGVDFKAIVGDFNNVAVRELFGEIEVRDVSKDEKMHVQEYVLQDNAPRHLQHLTSSSPTSHQTYVYNSNSGIGVDVYVFDTGIDDKNPDLQGVNVLKYVDLTRDIGPSGFDSHGHGTAMAGVIAGSTFGVLKQCNLIDMRVVEKDGSSTISNLIRSLIIAEKHVELTKRPSVFMIPLLLLEKNAILNSAFENLNRKIAIALPAGNQNLNSCHSSPTSSRKSSNMLVFGSLGEDTDWASFTNFGECVDMFTSGTNITTLSTTYCSQSGLIRQIEGTSVSCAIGSGVIGYYMSLGANATKAIEKIKDVSQRIVKDGRTYNILHLTP